MAKRRVRKVKRAVKKKLKLIFSIILCFTIIGGVFCFSDFKFLDNKAEKKEKVKEEKKEEVIIKEPKEYTARLFMVGDSLIHISIYYDAKQAYGTYNFMHML